MANTDTIYIKWPIAKDEQFRAKYHSITGEGIQTSPATNIEQTHYLVGSSRITQLQVFTLRALFPLSGIFFGNSVPNSWVEDNTT